MLNMRTITYRDFCIIMYWAGKAGVAGASKYGLRPDSPNGHYARKCKRATAESVDADALYSLEISGRRKTDVPRAVHDNIVMAPRELLAKDIVGLAGLRTQLMDATASSSLPPSYDDHVVVARSPICRSAKVRM
jgi:hypothetical protein